MSPAAMYSTREGAQRASIYSTVVKTTRHERSDAELVGTMGNTRPRKRNGHGGRCAKFHGRESKRVPEGDGWLRGT